MTPHPELAALAATAAADPRKARSAVNRLARPLPAADLPPFYEEACRVFHAAGEDELATAFFTQARKVEKKHPALVDLDRLHAVFLEFAPLGVVAPTVYRDLVKLMAPELPPRVSYERFNEILDAAFAAGRVPYARIFPDARTLARAAKIKKVDAEDSLAERLLRTGALVRASHAVWDAAGEPLVRVAGRDDGLVDLLVAAEPRPDDPETAERIREMWLWTLAAVGAGARLPAEWFFTHVRRCPSSLALQLTGQAGTLPRPEPSPDPALDPLVTWPLPEILRPGTIRTLPRWWSDDETLARIGERLSDPRHRDQIAAELERAVTDLGHYSNVDYRATLRRIHGDTDLRALLLELVERWTAEVASGSLPDLAHGLSRLAPLAAHGYYGLEPDAPRPAPASPVEVLRAALSGGIPAELHYPYVPPHILRWKPRMIQNGDHLTGSIGDSFATVYTPEGILADARTVGTRGDQALWYDGDEGFFLTERVGDGWRTFRVVGHEARTCLVTLDPATVDRRPDCPPEAEVTLPGADGPTRIAYARGRITFTAPDGTVTARVFHPPFEAASSHERDGEQPLMFPPGWYARMTPVDVYGSQALRRTTRDQAERLLDAALAGPAAVAEALDEIMPDVVERPLRDGIAATARTAATCLYAALRLTAALGLPRPDGVPAWLRTHPRLPVGGQTAKLGALRRVAEILQEAASRSDAAQVHPLGRVEVPRFAGGLWIAFGTLGGQAIEAARAWTPRYTRERLLDELAAWGNTPLGDGDGRWRVHYLTSLTGDRQDAKGELWRTPSGAALILGYQGHPHRECYVLEHSPTGDFAPLNLPGWRQRRLPDIQGWGGTERIAAFRELLNDRGPLTFPASLARDLADRAGFTVVDAAEILFKYPYFVGTPREVVDAYPAEIHALFEGPDGTKLKAKVPYPVQDAVRDALMPDDPADLWKSGPDLARAAARYRELEGL
ncbi:hypothetical protein GCM10009678_25640 [Actinomadura kijaniata]|uniref:Uncharacterized protein n=1 Tax=Actinomadura namibiensis TaxID=182080 RepID=A0A7W3LUG1_ACTNM|nr:hypothetical protein [Actinomadura namibiensis]MBA8954556.1 hypothetical protein [Actinomadura namibiensis]